MAKRIRRTQRKRHQLQNGAAAACRHPDPYGRLGDFFWCPACGSILLNPQAGTLDLENPWTMPTHHTGITPKNLRRNDRARAK